MSTTSIELLCPVHYTGEFATISDHRGKQLTFWWFGKPKWHVTGKDLDDALIHIFSAGWDWATEAMKNVFEQDVIMTGE